jgi:hypothetical protein
MLGRGCDAADQVVNILTKPLPDTCMAGNLGLLLLEF